MARRGENIHKRKDGRWEGRYIKDARQTEEFAGAISMAQHTRRSNSGSFIRSQSMGDFNSQMPT